MGCEVTQQVSRASYPYLDLDAEAELSEVVPRLAAHLAVLDALVYRIADAVGLDTEELLAAAKQDVFGSPGQS